MVSIPLKHTSQLGFLFRLYGTIKHVSNHQPVYKTLCVVKSCQIHTCGCLTRRCPPLIQKEQRFSLENSARRDRHRMSLVETKSTMTCSWYSHDLSIQLSQKHIQG